MRAGAKSNQVGRCRTKKEIDAVEVDERILEEQITVHGSYRKPKLSETAIVQVWFLPYYAATGIAWQVRWLIKYGINKEPYAQEDKEYLTRTCLNLSKDTWSGLDDKKKGQAMALELWVPENEDKFREQQKQASRQGRHDDYSDED